MAERDRRSGISLEHRERIVRAFDDANQDYIAVADRCAQVDCEKHCSKFVKEGKIEERPRGGRNNVRVDDEMKDCLHEIIKENCLPTLWQINDELRRRLPDKPEIHNRTVALALDGMLLRVKPGHQTSLWQMVFYISVFVDECGYNKWTSRSHGRARVGERAYRQVCGQRGRNVTIWLSHRSMA